MKYEVPEKLKNINLPDIGWKYPVAAEKLTDEAVKYLSDAECILCRDGDIREGVYLSEYDIQRFGIPHDDVDWINLEWDDWDWDLVAGKIIKNAEHYLVYVFGIRWNGADGYRFNDDFRACFARDYDAMIYPKNVSRNGKTLLCVRYSHDVPTGSQTCIIALTDREYNRLNKADFNTVKQFVEKCRDAV